MRSRGKSHASSGCSSPRDGPKMCRWTAGLSRWGKKHPWLIWLLPLAGLVSLIWFVIRVVPKPSRATYPCQRIAAPLASGFVLWIAGLVGSTLAYRKARRLLGGSRYVVAGFLLVAAVGAIWLCVNVTVDSGAGAAFTPADPPNSPMGVARGIYPGRVMWIHDSNATSWNGSSGSWWDDNNTDQDTVDSMLSRVLQGLTGESSDPNSWEYLLRHFNKTRGLGDVGYEEGEKVAVKINLNQQWDRWSGWSSNAGMPSPHVIYGVVKQLIENAGVPGSAITIYDASRYIGDPIYYKVRSNPNPDYQAVRFVVRPGSGHSGDGRIGATPDTTNPLYTRAGIAYLPECVTEAKYLINMALLRAHSLYGVTLCAKNHFGSTYFSSWTPEPLHDHGDRSDPMGSYNCLVNLNGHSHLGGKTLLYLIDGLYSAINQSSRVVRFVSFGNDWCSSILASQDPVAIDSVGLDFLRYEDSVNGSINDVIGHPDNYLHEAAQADSPPSGPPGYDPENDGVRLKSLGVHEHWNNPTDRQYSRNLGTGDGIELVSRADMWSSPDGPVRNLATGRRYDRIQYAINDARAGDEIVLPEQTYPESIDLGGKNLILRSIDPNDPAVVAATVINGGAGGPVVTCRSGEDANCVLAGLTITGGEVGVYSSEAAPAIINCYISGNTGAGTKLVNLSNSVITDCSIVGNGGVGVELSWGRGIISYASITNCTIVGNAGQGIFSGVATITNCIIYYNDGVQIDSDYATVTYSDVQGGWLGLGNIDCDPCFADPCNGDYHLKSEAGRWHRPSLSWVKDQVTSCCIDAGDPNSDWTAELWPHGERINMGAFGGTPEASMSRDPVGNGADFDLDGDVDFRDFDEFARRWRVNQVLRPEDLNRDGRTDALDLAILAGEWLWER